VLARQVGDELDLAHGQRLRHQPPVDQSVIGGIAGHPLRARGLLERGRRQRRHAFAQQALADVDQFGDAARPARAPERLEVLAHLARRRSGHQHVAVAEVVDRIPVVIVVGVVAAAGDADRAVDQQQLGVHALVELAPAARGCEQVLGVAQVRAVEHRVVDADFEIRVRARQRGQRVHAFERRQLVDQHPHAHAAPGRGQQFVQEQLPGIVLVEDVGLQVDRRGRAAHQAQPRDQRVLAAVEDQRVMPRVPGPALRERLPGKRVQGRGSGAGVVERAGDGGVARLVHQRSGAHLLFRREGGTRGRAERQQQHQGAAGEGHPPSPRRRSRRRNCTSSRTATCQRSMP